MSDTRETKPAPENAPAARAEILSSQAHWRTSKDALIAALYNPFLLMLMLGSILLSVASFYTTYAGMENFMNIAFVTFCIVFAIQALLFVTSWRIGFSVANRETWPFFTTSVFIICLIVSVGFSWLALFETINDEGAQERTRTARMHRAVDDALSELQARAPAHRREAAAALLGSDAYADWRAGAERVAEAALASQDAQRARHQARMEAMSDQLAALEAQRRAARLDAASVGERAEAASQRIEALTPRAEALRQEVDAQRSALADARTEAALAKAAMDAEEQGGGEGRLPGRGPRWRELRDAYQGLLPLVVAQETLLDNKIAELEEVEAVLIELRAVARVGGGGDRADLAAIDAEIAAVQDAQANAQAEIATLDVAADAARMRAELAQFASRQTLDHFDAALAACAELVKVAEAGDRSATLSCDAEPLAGRLNAVRAATESLRALEAECAPNGAAALTVGELAFAEAAAYGRKCVTLSGLPAAKVDDLRDEIERILLEEDPDASPIVKTTNAFLAGDKLSYFALAIAAFIDLLVLLSGLIGASAQVSTIAEHFSRRFGARDARLLNRALTNADGALGGAGAFHALLEEAHHHDAQIRRQPFVIDLSHLTPEQKAVVKGFFAHYYGRGLAVQKGDTIRFANGFMQAVAEISPTPTQRTTPMPAPSLTPAPAEMSEEMPEEMSYEAVAQEAATPTAIERDARIEPRLQTPAHVGAAREHTTAGASAGAQSRARSDVQEGVSPSNVLKGDVSPSDVSPADLSRDDVLNPAAGDQSDANAGARRATLTDDRLAAQAEPVTAPAKNASDAPDRSAELDIFSEEQILPQETRRTVNGARRDTA